MAFSLLFYWIQCDVCFTKKKTMWCLKQMIIIALSDNSEKNNSLLYLSLHRVVKGSNLAAGPSSLIGIILFFLCEQFHWTCSHLQKEKKNSFDMYESNVVSHHQKLQKRSRSPFVVATLWLFSLTSIFLIFSLCVCSVQNLFSCVYTKQSKLICAKDASIVHKSSFSRTWRILLTPTKCDFFTNSYVFKTCLLFHLLTLFIIETIAFHSNIICLIFFYIFDFFIQR